MSFALSEFYDSVNGSAYAPYAEYLSSRFEKADIKVHEVLDLGCGTGGICARLADMGYDMTGLDIDTDMLVLARENNIGRNTLLLCQDMREFELYGTVQAVYSSFDCINYLTEDGDLQKLFSLVRNYLEKGGVFVFDLNTEARYKNVFDKHCYSYDTENGFLVWNGSYDAKRSLCSLDFDVFTVTENGLYRRESESQLQRFYSEDEVLAAAHGFTLSELTGGKGFDGCAENEKNYYVFVRN